MMNFILAGKAMRGIPLQRNPPSWPQINAVYFDFSPGFVLLILQGKFLRFGVPNSLPSFPMDVSMLKLDLRQSYCSLGFPSGNHHPNDALTMRG